MRIKNLLFVLLVLSGCKGIPLTSLPELIQADVLQDDPRTYAIAVEHTRDIATVRGSKSFYINVLDYTSKALVTSGSYRGVQYELGPNDRIRGLTHNPNTRIYVYTLHPRDVAKLMKMQAYLADLKQQGKARRARGEGPTRQVNGGFRFKSCLTSGTAPKDPKGTLYARIRKNGPFVPVYRNVPIQPYLDALHDGPLQKCEPNSSH